MDASPLHPTPGVAPLRGHLAALNPCKGLAPRHVVTSKPPGSRFRSGSSVSSMLRPVNADQNPVSRSRLNRDLVWASETASRGAQEPCTLVPALASARTSLSGWTALRRRATDRFAKPLRGGRRAWRDGPATQLIWVSTPDARIMVSLRESNRALLGFIGAA